LLSAITIAMILRWAVSTEVTFDVGYQNQIWYKSIQ